MNGLTAPDLGLNTQKQQRGQWKKHRTQRVYDDKGRLTAYGFSCGYTVNDHNAENGNTKRMYKEHNFYHVQGVVNGRKIWETWEATGTGLTDARAYYKNLLIS